MYISISLYIYIYIYICRHTHFCRTPEQACPRSPPTSHHPAISGATAPRAGAKSSTPEIDISEIIVDVQWHVAMNFQWHVPKDLHCSTVYSKGLSLSQWICAEHFQWNSVVFFKGNFTFVSSGVYIFAPKGVLWGD